MERKIIFLFVLAWFTGGCSIDKGVSNEKHSAEEKKDSIVLSKIDSAQQPVQKSNLTRGMAKTRIIKGQAAQNIILEVFGAANSITKNKKGNKVWTYDKVSVETGALSENGAVFTVSGVGSKASTSTSIFNLAIEFDHKDIVKDFSYKSAPL